MPQLDRKEQLERLLRKSRAAKALRYSEHVLGKGASCWRKPVPKTWKVSFPSGRTRPIARADRRAG